jgi:hypothetical protein
MSDRCGFYAEAKLNGINIATSEFCAFLPDAIRWNPASRIDPPPPGGPICAWVSTPTPGFNTTGGSIVCQLAGENNRTDETCARVFVRDNNNRLICYDKDFTAGGVSVRGTDSIRYRFGSCPPVGPEAPASYFASGTPYTCRASVIHPHFGPIVAPNATITGGWGYAVVFIVPGVIWRRRIPNACAVIEMLPDHVTTGVATLVTRQNGLVYTAPLTVGAAGSPGTPSIYLTLNKTMSSFVSYVDGKVHAITG